jgi:two-component system cell cycle sensor histidine kinase/response regulator CckA
MAEPTAQDADRLLRKIEYLESQVHQLQADNEALRRRLSEAENAGIQNKLDALNRLTHGIAHELNNLLTPIIACSHLIKDEPGLTAGVLENADQLIETSERLMAVTRKMHALYPKAAKRFQNIDLNAHVRHGIELLQPVLTGHVHLVIDLDPAAGLVQGDTGLVDKIVLELGTNACEAMPCGGSITIRTAHGAAPGGNEPAVVLTVRDEGIGMKPEARAHLYEPYFTTKEPARGHGFGLAGVYGNVMRCGASIQCDSEPGRGTEFRIYFRKSA